MNTIVPARGDITSSGACVSGAADGRGVAQWFHGGKPGGRYEGGGVRGGNFNGRGVGLADPGMFVEIVAAK